MHCVDVSISVDANQPPISTLQSATDVLTFPGLRRPQALQEARLSSLRTRMGGHPGLPNSSAIDLCRAKWMQQSTGLSGVRGERTMTVLLASKARALQCPTLPDSEVRIPCTVVGMLSRSQSAAGLV